MATSKKNEDCMETCEWYLQDAEKWFDFGDFAGASEQAWKAVEHYLKWVAESRGWPLDSMAELNKVALDLAQETDDPKEALTLSRGAFSLEHNSFENWYGEGMVGSGIRSVRKLISMYENRTRPYMEPRLSSMPRRPIRR